MFGVSPCKKQILLYNMFIYYRTSIEYLERPQTGFHIYFASLDFYFANIGFYLANLDLY
jgi:hypothetical protein